MDFSVLALLVSLLLATLVNNAAALSVQFDAFAWNGVTSDWGKCPGTVVSTELYPANECTRPGGTKEYLVTDPITGEDSGEGYFSSLYFDCTTQTTTAYKNADCTGESLSRPISTTCIVWDYLSSIGNFACVDVPTKQPTKVPTKTPTLPTYSPTKAPTLPTYSPTKAPTMSPTKAPTRSPTKQPTSAPSKAPTLAPTSTPSEAPTTSSPTYSPTMSPTKAPTRSPTSSPTPSPSKAPTLAPTSTPSEAPTTSSPTYSPTLSPTVLASHAPTVQPLQIDSPSASPSISPTTTSPSDAPTTETPTFSPTSSPVPDVTPEPSLAPTSSPTSSPVQDVTPEPSVFPTSSPTTEVPTFSPTSSPVPDVTPEPSLAPTSSPTSSPVQDVTPEPSVFPTSSPTTETPTFSPTSSPVPDVTPEPSVAPTSSPTSSPVQDVTPEPSLAPTSSPTTEVPTFSPTSSPVPDVTPEPSVAPTSSPTTSPVPDVTPEPSVAPTSSPTTGTPTFSPSTGRPSTSPSANPTDSPTPRPSHAPSTPAPSRSPTLSNIRRFPMPLAVTLYQGENCAKSPNAIYPLVSPQHTFAFTMPSNQIGPQFEPPPGQYICLNRTIKTANGRIFARAGVSYITQEPLDEVPVMPKDYFNVPWEELLGWRAEPWHTVFIVDKQISVEVWFTVDEFDPLPAATFNLFASREFQIRMHFQDCTRITIELHHTFYPTSKCPETIHFNYFRDEIPLDYGVFRRFLDPASPTNDAPTQFIVTWDYITDEIRFCLAKFRYMEPRCFTTPMQHLSDYCLPSWEVYEDRSFSSVYPQPSVSVYYAAVYNGTLSAQDVRVLYEHTPFATYADALYKDPSVLAEDENNPALLYLTGKE